jgi:PilZ domain
MGERRAAHRYKLALGIAVRRLPISKESGIVHARTRNVSTCGLYFMSDQRLRVGARLDLSLTLPAELTQGSPVVTIDARARVVRVDEKPTGAVNGVGVAALIERYNISEKNYSSLHVASLPAKSRVGSRSIPPNCQDR